MAESITSLTRRPAVSVLAEASGEHLPSYVTREQARAIINTATTQTHRLLLECLWQSGGRISEVLRLRPCDLDEREGALVLEGHARLTAYAMRPEALPSELEVLLGCSPEMGHWGLY